MLHTLALVAASSLALASPGESPGEELFRASCKGDLELVRGLLQGATPRVVDTEIETPGPTLTPLRCTITHGHAEVARALLAAKANPRWADETTLLVLALAPELPDEASDELVRLLVAAGAQLELPTNAEDPLQLAAARGSLTSIRLPLQHGARPIGRGGYCQPLDEAVFTGRRLEVVKLLWERGGGACPDHTPAYWLGRAGVARNRAAIRFFEEQAGVTRGETEPLPSPPRASPGERPPAAPEEPSRGGELAAVEAIIMGGGEAPADAEAALAQVKAAGDVVALVAPLAPGFPAIRRSDEVEGLRPGFHVVLLGFCPKEDAAGRLALFRALFPGTYARSVRVELDAPACPQVVGRKGEEAAVAVPGGARLTVALFGDDTGQTFAHAVLSAKGGRVLATKSVDVTATEAMPPSHADCSSGLSAGKGAIRFEQGCTGYFSSMCTHTDTETVWRFGAGADGSIQVDRRSSGGKRIECGE